MSLLICKFCLIDFFLDWLSEWCKHWSNVLRYIALFRVFIYVRDYDRFLKFGEDNIVFAKPPLFPVELALIV